MEIIWIEIGLIKTTDNYHLLREYALKNDNLSVSDVIYYELAAIQNKRSMTDANIIEVSKNDTSLHVKVFPNPTDNYFTFLISGNTGNVSVKIFDLKGIEVEEKFGMNSSLIKAGESISPGIYFAEVQDGNSVKILKVLKK